MFNEPIKNNYTITYDSWYTERKLSTDGIELQIDIGSAQHINRPNYLIASFQTAGRTLTPNKQNNVAISEKVIEKKSFCEIGGCRYPKDAVLTNFLANNYVDQFRDLKLFYKENVGEELMDLFIG